MTTLICQVKSRLPVAVVALFGTLDSNTAARMMIALRDVVADAPIALIVDAEHLVVVSERALGALSEFAQQSRLWPGTTIAIAGASSEAATMIRSVAGTAPTTQQTTAPTTSPATDQATEPATDSTTDPAIGPTTEPSVEPLPTDSDLDDGIDGSIDGSIDGTIALYDSVDRASAAATALPVPQRRSLALNPDRDAPARARRFVLDVCAGWGIGRVASLAELIASELVTNAVTHARTPMNMTLRLADDQLSVEVRDADPRPMFRPAPGTAGAPSDEHGRGLLVLDAMADAWGSSPTGDGKVVWANVRLT